VKKPFRVGKKDDSVQMGNKYVLVFPLVDTQQIAWVNPGSALPPLEHAQNVFKPTKILFSSLPIQIFRLKVF